MAKINLESEVAGAPKVNKPRRKPSEAQAVILNEARAVSKIIGELDGVSSEWAIRQIIASATAKLPQATNAN